MTITNPQLHLNNLIGNGFFPKELIPAFQTKQLSEKSEEIKNQTVSLSPEYRKKHKNSKCLYHSFPRNKVTRRNLGIPNPQHQLILSDIICTNWEDIYNFCKQSNLSASKLTLDSQGKYKRAVSPNYDFQISTEKIIISSGLRYGLYTDISRYYSTIYTHSIPWAIYGKNYAKTNRQNNLYGNLIDQAVRNTQDQQSIGIPIGTDTSFIISEIIGSAIDKKINDELDQELKGFRYVDDYYLFFKNVSDAESTLKKLHRIFNDFELEPNGEKTSIFQLPETFDSMVITDLKSFTFTHVYAHHNIRKKIIDQKEDLCNFFNKTFYYYNNFPNENIIKYALSKIKRISIHDTNLDLFIGFLLQCLVADPGIIEIVVKLLGVNKNRLSNKTLNKIAQSLNYFIVYQVELNHSYEVSWALYLSKLLNIKIEDDVAKKITNIQDSIVAILSFDLWTNRSDLINFEEQDLMNWQSLMNGENLHSEYWLLAYEANIKDWVPNSENDYVSSDEFFCILKEYNINFFISNDNLYLENNHENNDDDDDEINFY